MKIVTAFGQFGSGKDVFSDYLFTKLPWKRAAFANAVKSIYQSSFGVDREFVEHWKRIDEAPPGMLMPVRKSLQFIGDGFRKIKDDIWIEIALRDEGSHILLSDGRYWNEGRAVNHKNGVNVVLWRPGFMNDDPNPSESQILEIIRWCLVTDQDGIIDHSRKIGDCNTKWNDEHWILPEDIEEKVSHFHLFIRNDGDVEKLYGRIRNTVIPFVETHYAPAAH